jgi:outer membrane protein assembly factor BamB/tetratricopeptide (TPR) repeat protein
MIKGDLSSFSLGEVFQSLAVNNHTGTLKIRESGGEEKFVYFSKGEICLFSSKSNPNLRIGEILVRQGAISRAELESAFEEQQETQERLGKVLVKSFGLKSEFLQKALETKICEEIYDLFLLTDADFEFLVDHFPEQIFDSTQKSLHISINTYSVLMEGMRLADEWKVIHKKIQTYREIFAVEPGAVAADDDVGEQALLILVDGETPVYKMFDNFPGSRFECCKRLFELLGAGKIRPLTLDECRTLGEKASKESDTDKAIDFVQYAVDLAPDRPEPLVLIGDLLKRSAREEEGNDALLRGTMLFFDTGNHNDVLTTGEPLLRAFPEDQELLNAVFQSALSTSKRKVIAKAGDAFANLLVSKGAIVHAAEILLKVVSHFPKEIGRRLRVADLLRDSGDLSRSVSQLEEAAEYLTGKQNVGEKIKVLRQIFELDPDRHDIKQEIENLLSLQESLDKKSKRRVSIAGAMLIALLLLALVPFLYEVKARELLSHAKRVEEISHHNGDFSRAKALYEELLGTYGFSLEASEAESALDRLNSEEKSVKNAIERERIRREREQREQVEKVQEALTERVEEAKTHEKNGRFHEAFDIYKEMMDEFPDVPRIASIKLPLVVKTTPSRAQVEVNGTAAGLSPVVMHFKLGTELLVRVSRKGCKPAKARVTVGENWQLQLDLAIVPLREFKVSGPIHQPLDGWRNLLLFPSRDGFFYAVDCETDEVRWKRKVGRYGDQASNALYLEGDVVLGTVAGEIVRFSRNNGKSSWRQFIKSAVLASPSASPYGRWIAVGDLNGNLTLLDGIDGLVRKSYGTQNEILHSPVFWSSTLVAASEDNNLYLLSVPDMHVLHAEPLAYDVDRELVLHGDELFFVTRDGSLHAFDLPSRQRQWTRHMKSRISNQPKIYQKSLLLGTTSGKLVRVRLDDGKVTSEIQLSDSDLGDLLIRKDIAYCGTERGRILSVDLQSQTVLWSYESGLAITEAPVLVKKQLFVSSRGGNFRIMEVLE